MTTQTQLKLLLIEDSVNDATRFIDQLQEQLGENIEIEWVRTLPEAFGYLSGHERDQIWMDCNLPDLSQQNIERALKDLKSYVAPGDFHLISSTDIPVTGLRGRPAGNEPVMRSNDARILEIISQSWERKSSGGNATMRVDIAKMEMRTLNNEGRIEVLERLLQDVQRSVTAMLAHQEAAAIETKFIKDLVGKIPELESTLKKQQSGETFRIERLKLVGAIVGGCVTAIAAVSVAYTQFVLPKMLDRREQELKQDVKKEVQKEIKNAIPSGDVFPD